MTWISVNDKLPQPDTWVLVYTGKYHWIAQLDSSHGGIWVGVYENEYWHKPTHWMPLPTPPAKQAKRKPSPRSD